MSTHRFRMENLRQMVAHQAQAAERVEALVAELAEAVGPVWMWGDGEGGWVRETLEQAWRDAGLIRRSPQTYLKAAISKELRASVHERDGHRCQGCGTDRNLVCDHVIPEFHGGPTTLEHLQTLCGSCNSRKGTMSQETFMARIAVSATPEGCGS